MRAPAEDAIEPLRRLQRAAIGQGALAMVSVLAGDLAALLGLPLEPVDHEHGRNVTIVRAPAVIRRERDGRTMLP